MDPIEKLKNKLAGIAAAVRDIEKKAEDEDRLLSGEENEAIEKLQADFAATEKEISMREATAALQAKVAKAVRVTQPADVETDETPRARITGGLPSGATKGTLGFRNMGEWAMAARAAVVSKGKELDDRIKNAPSTFGAEGVNSDGGFAVPPDFRANILTLVMGEDSLLGRTYQQPTSSNQITMPVDSVTPWDTTNGPQVYAIAEGAAITASKPELKQTTIKANKYAALIPMTDELLEDAAAMGAYLSKKVPEKFAFRLNDDLINGGGQGTLQGLMSAPCKVTQAAEAAQGAGTIVAKNILKMYGRVYSECRKNLVWLANQDAEQQLQQLVMPGTNPSFPAYMPPGGFAAAPYGTLLGRPVIVTEACKAVGTEGDLIAVDLSQYITLVKGGLRQDVSIHLYFDSDHTTFRFIMRVGGQCPWPAALTRKNGNNTLSCIVTLNSSRA